jgi:hypothetical protein
MNTTTDPVTAFLDAVVGGTGIPTEIYAPGAGLDATVPHWRFEVHGAEDIAVQLSGQYAHEGRLQEALRSPLDGGEVVRFLLAWTEDDTPIVAHQVHLFDISAGRITRHTLWCGGRWDAALRAEIDAGLSSVRAQR